MVEVHVLVAHLPVAMVVVHVLVVLSVVALLAPAVQQVDADK